MLFTINPWTATKYVYVVDSNGRVENDEQSACARKHLPAQMTERGLVELKPSTITITIKLTTAGSNPGPASSLV